jgi:hypothetical protein
MMGAARLLTTLLSVLAVTATVTACGGDSAGPAGTGADDSPGIASDNGGGGGGEQGGGGGGDSGGGQGGRGGQGSGDGGGHGGGGQGGGQGGGGQGGGGQGGGGGGGEQGGGTEPTADNQVLVGPTLLRRPPPVQFQTVALGRTRTLAISVSNLGTARKITAVSIDGDMNDFRLDLGSCSIGSEIAAGDSCTLRVTFAPTEEGVRSAELGIGVEPGRPAGRSLEGNGSPRPAPAAKQTDPGRQPAGSDTGASDSGSATDTGTTAGDVAP